MERMNLVLMIAFVVLFFAIYLFANSVESFLDGYDLAKAASDTSIVEVYVDGVKVK